MVYPLVESTTHAKEKGSGVDDDHFRCTAEKKGNPPVKLEAEQKIELGTSEASDAELTLDVSQGRNGCMPYQLTVTVGTATIKKRYSPDCPDELGLDP